MKQTIKAARNRARLFDTAQVLSFTWTNNRATVRSGVVRLLSK